MKIAVAGCSGRMGRTLVEAICQSPDVELGAATVRAGSSLLSVDVGELVGVDALGVTPVDDLAKATDHFDLLIDFTNPETSAYNLSVCLAAGKKIVIGTTGFSDPQKQQITDASKAIAVVFAPNMAIGVNLSFKLIELAARIIGEDSDIEIIEAHHRNKVDAPSGTAIKMGEIVAQQLNRTLEECAVYGRQGVTGVRDKKTIGFETIRAGDIVGDHTVLFAAAGERIEITHKSSNRSIYATGSVRAARWLADKPNGLFDMQDVLGLN
ncbi:MAG: 4-hydroxy-tetrahydrodipicolinate reductase [Pseudomonadales bacterium]|nr:4-hydroxy-tetrahydrodipicolinate reductase [Pseudomonadales bacterium]